MFFKVYLDPAVSSEFSEYSHMFWMEYDVFPVRSGWLHVLLARAAQLDFWIMGSMYLGTGLDSAAASSFNWNWVGHINGNAIYNVRDPTFRDFLRIVIQYEPPNHFWKPFDVSIWRVLHAFPYTWPLFQRFRPKFLLGDFIHHWGFHITEADIDFSLANPDVYLIHGARYSAGNLLIRPKDPTPDVVWHDQIPKSLRLSVMIRSFVGDLDYAVEALRSAVKFIPNALEIVLVVPEGDVANFEKAVHAVPGARVVGEPIVMKDQNMQQKYSKLHADRYCEGDFVFHLDSDMVLYKELLTRDILWMSRPLLVYQRYSSLNDPPPAPPKIKWRVGTSFALGVPVLHEYSRSPLHVYPRAIYAPARARIEEVHSTDIVAFLTGRIGKHTKEADENLLFSDFNYLGAFAHLIRPDLISQAPLDLDERRHLSVPPPLVEAPLCQGNARLADNPEKRAQLIAGLRNVWDKQKITCQDLSKLSLGWLAADAVKLAAFRAAQAAATASGGSAEQAAAAGVEAAAAVGSGSGG